MILHQRDNLSGQESNADYSLCRHFAIERVARGSWFGAKVPAPSANRLLHRRRFLQFSLINTAPGIPEAAEHTQKGKNVDRIKRVVLNHGNLRWITS